MVQPLFFFFHYADAAYLIACQKMLWEFGQQAPTKSTRPDRLDRGKGDRKTKNMREKQEVLQVMTITHFRLDFSEICKFTVGAQGEKRRVEGGVKGRGSTEIPFGGNLARSQIDLILAN